MVQVKVFCIFSLAVLFLFQTTTKKNVADRIEFSPGDPVEQFGKFYETPLTSNTPKGWLLEFLKRQRSGMTGHPEVLEYPFNSCLWAGIIARDGKTRGSDWWRYEQTAYYTDGLLRAGYQLQDTSFINKGRAGVRYTLDHQQSNGRLGPDFFKSQWPIAVFFRVMQAEYSATGNQQIVEALHRHYLSYTPAELGTNERAIVNIEGMLWTYGKTGDKKLLDLAESAYALGKFDLNMEGCLSEKKITTHGVTYMEMAKLPAILYTFTGKQIYLDAAVNAMKKLDREDMLPDGVPSSNEFLDGNDPLASHETCDITDYTWAIGYLLTATGDAAWADRIEKAVFNAGPGAVSKDFRNLQYFSSVNQAIATGNSDHNAYKYGSTWMAYSPSHETECCAGNINRLMPNYISRMWMTDREGGIVAALYGPSEKKATLPDSKPVTIKELTDYPFSEQVSFVFSTPGPAEMPFSFRIPVWCTTASLSVNGKRLDILLKAGTFATIRRKFRNGDRLTLSLPMEVRVKEHSHWGLFVERGPLVYSYAIREKVTTDTAVYANLFGKRAVTPGFPALDIRPAANWNYTLDINQQTMQKKVRIITRPNTNAYPFDPGNAPVTLLIPAKRVKGWKLKDGRFTPGVPEKGSFETSAGTELIKLVPYGSTRLRITVFPMTE